MAEEERQSQEVWAGEKVYPNPGERLVIHILILAGCATIAMAGTLVSIFAIPIAIALYDVAIRDIVNIISNLGSGIAIFSGAIFAFYLIRTLGGYPIKEIAISKGGVVLRRGRKPIIIKKITSMEEMRSGRVLRLTGLTPEGKPVNRRLMWSDVGKKRWDEFKEDLKKIKTSD